VRELRPIKVPKVEAERHLVFIEKSKQDDSTNQ